MNKDRRINRRQFLAISMGLGITPFIPYSSFNFYSHNIKKTDSLLNETKKKALNPIISVIGVGGAGCNAINNMIDSNLKGVKFIAADTDAQALEISKASVRLQMGEKLIQGLSAGANPKVGRDAALENIDAIRNVLKGSHMVFIIAGFGGGTGTGATPVIAEICKEVESSIIAVVTKPFSFEGKKRILRAEKGIHALLQVADTVIVLPNDKLNGLFPNNNLFVEMFRKAYEMQLHSVKCITDLIMAPGLVCTDFADIQTIVLKAGMAGIGTGSANGKNPAIKAVEKAISHLLMEGISIANAKGVIMNITSGSNLNLVETAEAADEIYKELEGDTDIVWGTAIDENIGNSINVTIVTTGIC